MAASRAGSSLGKSRLDFYLSGLRLGHLPVSSEKSHVTVNNSNNAALVPLFYLAVSVATSTPAQPTLLSIPQAEREMVLDSSGAEKGQLGAK